MVDATVLMFPAARIANTAAVGNRQIKIPITVEDVKTNVDVVKQVYINGIVETMLQTISQQLGALGFAIEDEKFHKDSGLFVESLRSLCCKQYDIEHPFQQLADVLFTLEDDSTLKLVDHIDIEFGE